MHTSPVPELATIRREISDMDQLITGLNKENAKLAGEIKHMTHVMKGTEEHKSREMRGYINHIDELKSKLASAEAMRWANADQAALTEIQRLKHELYESNNALVSKRVSVAKCEWC